MFEPTTAVIVLQAVQVAATVTTRLVQATQQVAEDIRQAGAEVVAAEEREAESDRRTAAAAAAATCAADAASRPVFLQEQIELDARCKSALQEGRYLDAASEARAAIAAMQHAVVSASGSMADLTKRRIADYMRVEAGALMGHGSARAAINVLEHAEKVHAHISEASRRVIAACYLTAGFDDKANRHYRVLARGKPEHHTDFLQYRALLKDWVNLRRIFTNLYVSPYVFKSGEDMPAAFRLKRELSLADAQLFLIAFKEGALKPEGVSEAKAWKHVQTSLDLISYILSFELSPQLKAQVYLDKLRLLLKLQRIFPAVADKVIEAQAQAQAQAQAEAQAEAESVSPPVAASASSASDDSEMAEEKVTFFQEFLDNAEDGKQPTIFTMRSLGEKLNKLVELIQSMDPHCPYILVVDKVIQAQAGTEPVSPPVAAPAAASGAGGASYTEAASSSDDADDEKIVDEVNAQRLYDAAKAYYSEGLDDWADYYARQARIGSAKASRHGAKALYMSEPGASVVQLECDLADNGFEESVLHVVAMKAAGNIDATLTGFEHVSALKKMADDYGSVYRFEAMLGLARHYRPTDTSEAMKWFKAAYDGTRSFEALYAMICICFEKQSKTDTDNRRIIRDAEMALRTYAVVLSDEDAAAGDDAGASRGGGLATISLGANAGGIPRFLPTPEERRHLYYMRGMAQRGLCTDAMLVEAGKNLVHAGTLGHYDGFVEAAKIYTGDYSAACRNIKLAMGLNKKIQDRHPDPAARVIAALAVGLYLKQIAEKDIHGSVVSNVQLVMNVQKYLNYAFNKSATGSEQEKQAEKALDDFKSAVGWEIWTVRTWYRSTFCGGGAAGSGGTNGYFTDDVLRPSLEPVD